MMFLFNLVAAVLAVTLPAPSASPGVPKTIITVKSSPYCNSLGTHFNDALVPMLANDRTFAGVSVQLDDLNQVFLDPGPNYQQEYLHVRDMIGKQEQVVNNSLTEIQTEITALRQGSALTTDPEAAAEVHLAAQDLQTAYDHQRQLAIDLQELHRFMISYPLSRVRPAMGGFNPQDMSAPEAERNIKTYLHFEPQRDIISTNEGRAADVAIATAEKYCAAQQ
jgi:hypothetical protein